MNEVNDIGKDFQGVHWRQELIYMSWVDLRYSLKKKSIDLLNETIQKLFDKEKIEIDEYVFRILVKYLTFSYEKNEVLHVFDFIHVNYDIKFINKQLSSLVFENELIAYKSEKGDSNHTYLDYLEIIYRNEKKFKNIHENNVRIDREVCRPSFEKYMEIYKKEYGYTYISPNKTSDSSNYGIFLDTIKKDLQKQGIHYDLELPDPDIGFESTKRKMWEEIHGEGYSSFTYFLDGSFGLITPKVSKIIRDLLTPELLDLYVELKIKYEIKRFFLLGGITLEHLMTDNIYKYGFNYCQKHCSPNSWHFYLWTILVREEERRIKNGEPKFYEFSHYSNLVINQDEINENIKYLISLNPLFTNHTFIHEGNHELELCSINLQKIKEFKFGGLVNRIDNFIGFRTPHFDNVQIHELITDKKRYYEYLDSFRGPENEIREILGLPKIGEGWISETKLFYLVKEKFNNHRVLQHGKPKWLGKQHLDIYIPDLNIGIEYQGKQHVVPIGIFGGEISFQENKKRDLRKKKLCEENSCILYEVFPEDDFNVFVDKIFTYHG
jgi:hypothetical protein